MTRLSVSYARAHWPDVLDDALRGEWPLLAVPGGEARVVLLAAELALLHGASVADVPRGAESLRLLAREQVAPGVYRVRAAFEASAYTPGVWMRVAESRERFAELLAAAREAPQGVRRADEEYAVTDAGLLADRLARAWPFEPRVMFEAGGAAVWLPELGVYGRGADLDAATADLLDEMRVYAEDWQRELRYAPNHRVRFGWVRRIQLARDDAALARLLDDEPRVA